MCFNHIEENGSTDEEEHGLKYVRENKTKPTAVGVVVKQHLPICVSVTHPWTFSCLSHLLSEEAIPGLVLFHSNTRKVLILITIQKAELFLNVNNLDNLVVVTVNDYPAKYTSKMPKVPFSLFPPPLPNPSNNSQDMTDHHHPPRLRQHPRPFRDPRLRRMRLGPE